MAKDKLTSTLTDLLALTSPACRSQLTVTVRESSPSGLLHNPRMIPSNCPRIKVLPRSRSAGRLTEVTDVADITISLADLLARSADHCSCLKALKVQSLLKPTAVVVGVASSTAIHQLFGAPAPPLVTHPIPGTNEQAGAVLAAALYARAELTRYADFVAKGEPAKTLKVTEPLEYQATKLRGYNPALFDAPTHTLLCDLLAEIDTATAAVATTRGSTPVKDSTLLAVRKTLLGKDSAMALDDHPVLIAVRPPTTGRRRTAWSGQVKLLFEQFAIRNEVGLVVLVAPLYVYEFLADRPSARANGLMPCAFIADNDTTQILELAAGLWDPYAKGGLQSLYEALTTARLLATIDPDPTVTSAQLLNSPSQSH